MIKYNKLFCLLLFLVFISGLSCSKDSEIVKEKRNYGIFYVMEDNKTIKMDGVIKSRSLKDFQHLIKNFPNASLINIVNCGGSMDDEINLQLSTLVNRKALNTHLLDNAEIASGGVDFFLAGIKRTRGQNTKIGVHSWGTDQIKATDFAKGHQYHQEYISYYQKIGFTKKEAEEFYYFTIYAAPPAGIHWMTKEEIIKYKIITN